MVGPYAQPEPGSEQLEADVLKYPFSDRQARRASPYVFTASIVRAWWTCKDKKI